ncbi:MAG: mevalonate kinase [Candidatus Micrarchaeaceae archaeon]
MVVQAPGVVKLFGEHSVIYGKTALAAALEIYSQCNLISKSGDKFRITLPKLEKSIECDEAFLKEIFRKYVSRRSIKEFIEEIKVDKEILPFVLISSRLVSEYGVEIRGKEVTVSSDIPMKSGLASSAACALSFALSLIGEEKKQHDKEIIEIARDGERIAHANESGGGIDISTSYYGGYVTFSSALGAKKEDVKRELEFLLIDTGEKPPTSEMVKKVELFYKSNKEEAEEIFEQIDQCTKKGLSALENGNVEEVGRLMNENQELLRRLGVSSSAIEKAISVALNNGALGAKLTGGGGGGIVIAISKDSKRLFDSLAKENLKCRLAKVSLHGARAL